MTELMQPIAGLYNLVVGNKFTGDIVKNILGFSPNRNIPKIASTTLRKWFQQKDKPFSWNKTAVKSVYFFCDEFTNFNDVEIGKKAILLLEKLGYEVLMVPHAFSGRALLSKGLLRDAKKLANKNVEIFKNRLNADTKLVSVEPSTILTFRDEYVDLVDEHLLADAEKIAPLALTIEEFIWEEYLSGNISSTQFVNQEEQILLHGHCQQKAWGLMPIVSKVLEIPANYKVKNIPSGCCGMAGSFGYEKEHYDISMKIGDLVLFPTVREKSDSTLVAAPGASCRHQIMDGTGVASKHPVEILYKALK
jgi:Fe-S oxidoreductase